MDMNNKGHQKRYNSPTSSVFATDFLSCVDIIVYMSFQVLCVFVLISTFNVVIVFFFHN